MKKYRMSFLKRRYIVEKSYQLKFILKIVSFVFIATLITGLVTYFLTNEEIERNFYSIHYQIKNLWEVLLPSVVVISFVTTSIVAFFTTIVALYESHRVWGPIYRIKKTLHKIGEGNLDKVIKIRSKDELQELADNLNSMVMNLKKKMIAISKGYNRLNEYTDILIDKFSIKEETDIEDKELLQTLKSRMESLNDAIQQFKFKE